MIQKYVYGNPIETGAVVQEVSKSEGSSVLLHLSETDEGLEFSCRMNENDVVYGLGEQVRGINKRGFSYISYAADDPVHTENKHSLYGGHNFLILYRQDGAEQTSFGVFLDDPGKVVFDVGETKRDRLKIRTGKDCVVYVIEGDSLKDLAKQFRALTGQSYIAPKWAFGYQQSRWGYLNKSDVKTVVENHRREGIPLEAVYLDIDYMENYKDFTVDPERFSDFPEFVGEMKEQGIHLVPIIDAGVKIERGYRVYEEGVREHYFCREENGENFVGAVWPGKVHFPDVLNTKARAWFGGKYRWLIEQGIDGFWNDMNEPAIFYSEKNLKKVLHEISSIQDDNLDLNEFFHMQEIVEGLCNHPQDYQSFYHDMDGVTVCHDKVHNLYGFYMTKAAAEAFEEIVPDQRILLFSRSSYIGMHRYGGIWTGDNESWWSHLLLSIHQMPSLNLCGILYTGSDLGGFGSDVTEDLLLRWMAFAVFTPLMRNHAAAGTRMQEAYQFDAVESFRNLVRIRYALLPYLYSEYMKAALSDEMYIRPVSFDYPKDRHTFLVEDQLMVGESIMIAPVYTQNAGGRYVYLPEEMMLVRLRSDRKRTYQVLAGGHHYIDVALDEVVFFVKKNRMLPFAVLGDDVKTTQDVSPDRLVWIGFTDDWAEYTLYDDDGISRRYTPKEEWKMIRLSKGEMEGVSADASIV